MQLLYGYIRRLINIFRTIVQNISNCWVHDCFYRRLASFTIYNVSQKCYIPDIFKIMEKYGLTEHFDNYVKSNAFTSKIRWKHGINWAQDFYRGRRPCSSIERKDFGQLHLEVTLRYRSKFH